MRIQHYFIISSILLIPYYVFPQSGYDRNHLALLFQQQQFSKAIEYLKDIDTTRIDVNKTRWRNDLAYAYLHNEQETESLILYQKNFIASPSDIETNIYLAQLYGDLKKIDEALVHANILVNEQPFNPQFLQRAGIIYIQKGLFDSSLFFYSKAFELNPSSGNLAYSMTNVLIQLKKHKEAYDLIEKFILNDSSHHGIVSKWMEINFDNENYDTVIKWGNFLWQDSVQLTNPYIHFAYSFLYQKKFENAIAVCQWMEKKNLSTLASMYCEALAHKGLKDYITSNQILNKCINQTIQQEAQIYLQAMAGNYELMKDYKKAMNYYDTAYYIFKKPLDVYLAGRIADYFLKNKTKALAMYRLYQKLKPVPENENEQLILKYIAEYLKAHAQK